MSAHGRLDAAGRYPANPRIVEGRRNVARLLVGIAQGYPAPQAMTERSLNGQPAWLFEAQGDSGKFAPRMLVLPEVAADGRVRTLRLLLAPEKLAVVDEGRSKVAP